MTNCILITMDSVRWDHCSFSGYQRDTSPFIASLDGTFFTKAYANSPYTPASVPSLLTSTLPLENGHVAYSNERIIPDYFEDTSYTTGVVFNNVQIDRFGFCDCFDTAIDLSRSDTDLSNDADADADTRQRDKTVVNDLKDRFISFLQDHDVARAAAKDVYRRFTAIEQPHPTDSVVTDEAIKWINKVEEPYFLWVHYMDTHHPYHFDKREFEGLSTQSFDHNRYSQLLERAKTSIQSGDFVWNLSENEQNYIISAYDASIRHLDKMIDRLFGEIDNSRTNVILTADHGEELWDHGHFGHAARPSKPRAMTLYEEMLHVPLIMTGPDVPQQQEITRPVSLVDILPTILEMTSINISAEVRGTSLLKSRENGSDTIIAHATTPGDPSAYYDNEKSFLLGSARDGNYKYIHYENRPDELFNLDDDPGETTNIRDNLPRRAEDLRAAVRKTIDDSQSDASEKIDSRDVDEQLRRLGYKA